MKNSRADCYNGSFSHIYVEKEVADHARTRAILAKFPQAQVIEIGHYKDVFCRSRQNYMLQHKAQSLILAAKHGRLVYEGAPVCQSFGNENFYYTSCMMNCIYNCEYCYLKGMYPSGNVVVFVNLEDIFAELQGMLSEHPVYLCVSYDTDLLAFEQITGYAAEWVKFAAKCGREGYDLKIELRTKCASPAFWERNPATKNIVAAFTMSPEEVIASYEHGTSSLAQRIEAAYAAAEAGFPVRLCFDPMIYIPGWEEKYDAMLAQIFEKIDSGSIMDVSVGTFRVSQDYLKKMRKNEPDSAVVQFPYENDGGVYHYPERLTGRMEEHLVSALTAWIPRDKIFLWRE